MDNQNQNPDNSTPPEADSEIIERLKQASNQGLSFFQAKQALLQQGYKDEEIETAADSYEYGTKPATTDPVTAAFAKDPQDTEKIGQDILRDDKKQREEQALADGIAGEHSIDIQSDLKYQNKFLHDIGMSWWTWIVINIVLSGAIFWFRLPFYAYSIVGIIFVIIFSIKRT